MRSLMYIGGAITAALVLVGVALGLAAGTSANGRPRSHTSMGLTSPTPTIVVLTPPPPPGSVVSAAQSVDFGGSDFRLGRSVPTFLTYDHPDGMQAGYAEYEVSGRVRLDVPSNIRPWDVLGSANVPAKLVDVSTRVPREWAGTLSRFDLVQSRLTFWVQVPKDGIYTLFFSSRGDSPRRKSLYGYVSVDDTDCYMELQQFEATPTSAKAPVQLAKGWHRFSVTGSQANLARGEKITERSFTLYMQGPNDQDPVPVIPYAVPPKV